MDNKQFNQPRIVLIGGTGRSGTNITKEMLGRHSRVCTLPFEHRFTLDPDGLVDFYLSYSSAWSPYFADRKLKRLRDFLVRLGSASPLSAALGKLIRFFDPRGNLLAPRSYAGWNLSKFFPNYLTHVDRFIAELVDFSYAAIWVGTESYEREPIMLYGKPKMKSELASIIGRFMNALVTDLLGTERKDVFVEDNTWNILFGRELLDFTPQAKLLHIYRDPRDVVASLMRQRWAPKKPTEAAIWYRDIMSEWLKVKARLPNDCYMEISLEQLAKDTTKTMSTICAFMGLQLEPKMLDFDLSRAHLGRWKTDLKKDEITQIQTVLGGLGKDLGYTD